MPDELDNALIAIPGRYTTANLLFSIFWPGATRKREYLFSDIPGAVLSGEADAGLIIHETRFTYQAMGLGLVADTGHDVGGDDRAAGAAGWHSGKPEP
jgi:1,4-dihydroxy-6-naphthoate synthase